MQVAKVFIRMGEFYLFSRKRAPGKKKDGLLELVGGGCESGEAPLEALIREAAEEESSGRLAEEIRRQRPEHEEFVLSMSSADEPQYLFHIEIEADVAEALTADPVESYGFERISAALFDSDENLAALREEFTPKTLALLRAMGRSL